MATPQFQNFWQSIANREAELGMAFRVQARFSEDSQGLTPVPIVLEHGEPVVDVDEGLASLIGTTDPDSATQNLTMADATLWKQAFDEIRGKTRLTLNQACCRS